jgi:hypothetical protein
MLLDEALPTNEKGDGAVLCEPNPADPINICEADEEDEEKILYPVTAGGIFDPLKPPLLGVKGSGDEADAEKKEAVSEALEELEPDNKTKPGEENIDAATGLFGKLAAEVAVVVVLAPLAG